MAAHPDIDARISASLRYADFIADDVDVAIRLSNGVHSDLHVEKLFDDFVLPVCSPQLVESGLRRLDDLSRFTLIHYDIPLVLTVSAIVGRLAEGRRRFGRGSDARAALQCLRSRARCCCRRSRGAYKLIASEDVRSGRLVIPFGPELPITERAYHFVCLKGQETRPNVRAFRDWLFSEMDHTVAQWAALTIAPPDAP